MRGRIIAQRGTDKPRGMVKTTYHVILFAEAGSRHSRVEGLTGVCPSYAIFFIIWTSLQIHVCLLVGISRTL